MSPTTGSINPAIAWSKVDILTSYQRVTGELQVRGRLRDTMNDSEPLFHLRNVSAEPLLPGAVQLNGVPEGLFNKALIGGIRTIDPEPPPPDQVMEVVRRYIMFQAGTFMVTGAAEFPKAAETAMHNEILLKGRFFQVLDATVTIFGAAGKAWTQPAIYVNRDHMLAVYLG
ncbi:MAG TPA: hypothetical protein VJT78_06375 [Candidatus Dormibacteraeota bacterium]|nr:hypothetical protein [Candidatus Dormibacteraeota bacterium]